MQKNHLIAAVIVVLALAFAAPFVFAKGAGEGGGDGASQLEKLHQKYAELRAEKYGH
jgi:hypothetical protein